MSDLWAYAAEKCDNDYCPYDCDRCGKAEKYSFREGIEDVLENSWFHGDDEQRQKILNISEDERFSADDVVTAIWMCSSAEYTDVYSEVERVAYECF